MTDPGRLQHKITRTQHMGIAGGDDQRNVGQAVAIDIALDQPVIARRVGRAQLSGDIAERRRADEAEGIVAIGIGENIEPRQVDEVADRQIADMVLCARIAAQHEEAFDIDETELAIAIETDLAAAVIVQPEERQRATLADPPPAIIITGEVDSPLLRDAGAAGITVLHKPVQAAQLRRLLGEPATRADSALPVA